MRDTIAELDSGALVYNEPEERLLYDEDEIVNRFSEVVGLTVPEEKRNPVQTSHFVKEHLLDELGYEPRGFRISEARDNRPKFKHQLLDIYVQSTDNLQLWGFTPGEGDYSMDDIRVAIVKHEDYTVTSVEVVTMDEVSTWDTTGSKTIKWQAGIGSLDETIVSDGGCEYITSAVSDLVGESFARSTQRVQGAAFEKAVADSLGVSSWSDDGTFPDIPQENVEVKVQTSDIIDLGKHNPLSPEAEDATYVVGVASVNDNTYTIDNIIVTEGRNFDEHLNIFAEQSSKLQMAIPDFDEW